MGDFRVGEWRVRPQLARVEGPAGTRQLELKALGVLLELAENAGEVVSREALLETVWNGAIVGEEVLSHAVWELRKAFGDNARKPTFIETIPRRGYRLVAPVSWLDAGLGAQERYELEEEIGSGAMGVVWRARDTRLDRSVALKFLAPELSRDQEAKKRFLREAKVAAGIEHPNVCTLHEVDETADGRLYLVMPWYRGETLEDRLAHGPLPIPQAVEIVAQVADGLAVAHAAGIVHRDVKPGNVMLVGTPGESRSERAVLLDFGLAMFSSATRMTKDGSSFGTPAYMSPEQTRGERVGPQGDLWSLGVLCYELITGELPFPGGNQQAIIYSIFNEEPVPLDRTELDVPDSLEGLLRSTLRKDPSERPDDAADISAKLRASVDCGSDNSRGLSAILDDGSASPYPGLSPFSRQQSQFFFGRRVEIQTVWAKLPRRSLTAIIGPSGAGKSSFLRAGILSALPSGWRFALFNPGSGPFVALGESLVSEHTGDPGALRRLMHFDDPDVAYATIATWRGRHPEVLLIIDQFEELFILNDREQQARFCSLLGRLTTEAGVRVILTMRDDFFFGCHAFPELEDVFTGLVPLGPPAGEALEEALIEPARRCGYHFEDDGLVAEMLAAVAGERGALPLLAFAAERLWELRDRERRMLTRAAYEQIGGVGGALAQHAEEIMLSLGPEHEPLARDLFRTLLSAEGTRAARNVDELLSLASEREEMEEVLARFVDGRLLTRFDVPGDEASQRVEIIHESLLSAWPRLVRWQTQDADSAQLRDQLRRSAKLWDERQKPDDLLWTGTSFLEFQAWRARYSGALTAAEELFAQAMIERAGRRRRRARWATALAAAVAVTIMMVVGILWRDAETARRAATAEALRAEASELVALGQLELGVQPSVALAYSLRGLELADQPAARRLALAALAEGPPSSDLGGGWVNHLVFTPDGEWLVAGCLDGRVLAWSRHGGEARELTSFVRAALVWLEPGVLATASGAETLERRFALPDLEPLIELDINDVADSVGGFVFGTTFDQPNQSAPPSRERQKLLRAWPLEGGVPKVLSRVSWDTWEIADGNLANGPEFLFLQDGAISAIPVSDDGRGPGRQIASWSGGIESFTLLDDGVHFLTPVEESTRLALWSLTSGLVHVFDPGEAFSSYRAAGDIVAIGSRKGHALWTWSLTDGQAVGSGTLTVPQVIDQLELSPDGSRLAVTTTESATVYLFELPALADARPVALRRGHSTGSRASVFHPQSNLLATSGITGIRLWPLVEPLPFVVSAHPSPINGVAFSPDGLAVASTSLGYHPDETHLVRLDFLDHRLPRSLFEEPSRRVAFTSDGNIVASTRGGTIQVLSPDGAQVHQLSGKLNPWGVATDSSGLRIAAGGGNGNPDDSSIRVWDLGGDADWPEGSKVLGSGDVGWITDLEFVSPQHLLSGSGAGLQLWDVETETFEWLLERKAGYRVLGADDSGQIVATVGSDFDTFESDTIWVLDRARDQSWEVISHGSQVIALDVSPDGQSLLSGDWDGVVRVGPISGEEPHLLVGHFGTVWDLDVNPDGSFLVSSGQDGDLRLWPMPQGPPLHTLPSDEFLAMVRRATNLRVVDDDTAPGSQYGIEAAPFLGW